MRRRKREIQARTAELRELPQILTEYRDDGWVVGAIQALPEHLQLGRELWLVVFHRPESGKRPAESVTLST
ncbi:MAG TPA: hypothetical protein VJP02_00520 [Candidatus Sulfotelmatobacter sp.]|nr:hypothetical protein [Candidatus Sulfotelmatobacter sp.]